MQEAYGHNLNSGNIYLVLLFFPKYPQLLMQKLRFAQKVNRTRHIDSRQHFSIIALRKKCVLVSKKNWKAAPPQ